MNTNHSLHNINKIGDKTIAKLNKLGIYNLNDLVFHFPFRYEYYQYTEKIKDIEINTDISINLEIQIINSKKSFKKRLQIIEAIASDGADQINIVWFNQVYISKTIKNGDYVNLKGPVHRQQGRLVMMSPIFEKIYNKKENKDSAFYPIYKLSSGLTQKQIQYFVKQAFSLFAGAQEYVPLEIIEKLKLSGINKALSKIHYPQTQADIDEAQTYFKFLEIFLFQLKSYFINQEINKNKGFKLDIKLDEIKSFINSLDFELTDDQKKCSWEILQDTNNEIAMSRLLQGDVGSGKTIVAIIAMLNCALNKQQAILMVPTEILAKQHYQSILNFFKNTKLKIATISSSNKEANFEIEAKNKKDLSNKICQEADIIIGTHSLIQADIHFKKLSLVIVDEQHRFGVNQRQEIIKKSENNPHFLSMTATPIPRSLSLALFSGLKLSNIKTKPKNRLDIKTEIIIPIDKNKAYAFVEQEIKKGRQAFVICPLIEEEMDSEIKSVKKEYKELSEKVFPNLKIEILHGKMKSKEKDLVMQDFLDNKINIIVATSVIEVGIDVPNASIMIIEEAEKFGLAQLHQFRGRVGRSHHQSYCFLSVSDNKLKNNKRLEALKQYNNGLDLAKVDLENRGSGQIYGKIQSGFQAFKFLSIYDHQIINQSKEELEKLLDKDPHLEKHPILFKKIQKNIQEVHLE